LARLPNRLSWLVPGLGSAYARNVLKLFYGTSLKNLLTFLALPVLTRLYSPKDIGLFQLLLSVSMTFSIVSTLKYEMAIVLPRYRREAEHLVALTLLSLVATTIVTSALFAVLGARMLRLFKAGDLAPYGQLVVASIFATGLLQGARYLQIREKQYGDLARNNILQAVVTQAGSIGAGVARPSFLGLFGSYALGCLVPALVILYQARVHLYRLRRRWLRPLAWKHRQFPLISTVSMFLQQLTLELPVFMFSGFYGAQIVGYYALAHRLLTTPMNLIQTSVGQVFFQEASDAYNQSPARLLRVYLVTIRRLALVGIGPLVLALIAAPPLVKLFLGAQWATSGTYIQIIVFGIYFGFINAPIGTTYSIIGRQEIILYLRIASIILRFGSMYVLRRDPILMLWASSLSMSLYYIVCNIMVYVSVRRLLPHASR
jgi:lipopolysaccharide exporter